MKAVWSRRALRHLVALREYIAQDSDRSASDLAEQILNSVEIMQSHPAMGRPGRVAGTRELVVPDTPYLVVYQIRGERLELLAVLHGRRKWPDKF
jgi:addiction module RelE/StbE family toxin